MALGILGANSIFGGNLFGTKQGTTETQSSSSPWAPAQPHYQNIFGQAQALYQQPSAFSQQRQGMVSDTLAGKYMMPGSNPFFASQVQDALGLAGSAFAGQYGGAAGSQLGNSGYQEGLARTLGTLATNAYSDNYARERQNQLGALAFDDPAWQNLLNYKEAITTPFGQTTQQNPFYENRTAQTLGILAGLGGLASMGRR